MSDSVRLDVWLDVACLVKTRSQAKELCDGGKIEIAGVRAKAHRPVRVGEHVRISLAPGVQREVVVRALAERHMAKADARRLFEDVTPAPSPEELELRQMRRYAPAPAPPKGAGRPEKRDRRLIERFRGR